MASTEVVGSATVAIRDSSYESNVLETLRSLRRAHCDVNFHCGDGQIVKSQRVVLALASPLLRTMFLDQPPYDTVEIYLPQICSTDLEILLCFLLEGCVRVSEEELLELRNLLLMLGMSTSFAAVNESGEQEVSARRIFKRTYSTEEEITEEINSKQRRKDGHLLVPLEEYESIVRTVERHQAEKRLERIVEESVRNHFQRVLKKLKESKRNRRASQLLQNPLANKPRPDIEYLKTAPRAPDSKTNCGVSAKKPETYLPEPSVTKPTMPSSTFKKAPSTSSMGAYSATVSSTQPAASFGVPSTASFPHATSTAGLQHAASTQPPVDANSIASAHNICAASVSNIHVSSAPNICAASVSNVNSTCAPNMCTSSTPIHHFGSINPEVLWSTSVVNPLDFISHQNNSARIFANMSRPIIFRTVPQPPIASVQTTSIIPISINDHQVQQSSATSERLLSGTGVDPSHHISAPPVHRYVFLNQVPVPPSHPQSSLNTPSLIQTRPEGQSM